MVASNTRLFRSSFAASLLCFFVVSAMSIRVTHLVIPSKTDFLLLAFFLY